VKRKSSGCLSAIVLVILIGIVVAAVGTCTDTSRPSTGGRAGEPDAQPSKPAETGPTAEARTAAPRKTEAKPSPLVALPSLQKPPEPDWDQRRAYWEQSYDARAKDPAIGKQITLRLASGANQSGQLTSLTPEAVTIKGQNVELTLQRSQLDRQTQQQLWPSIFRSAFVAQQVGKERKEYASRLASAYDDVIHRINLVAAEYEAQTRTFGKTISGKVSQVIGDDALLYREGYDEPFYVEGIGSSVVDGSVWQGTVYNGGTMEYLTVLGAPKKVIKFTILPPPSLGVVIRKKTYVESELASAQAEKTRAIAEYK